MSKVYNYISEDACLALQTHIDEAGGNEVFLVGYLDEDQIVDRVEVFARGNKTAAPALLQVASQGDVVIHNHPSGGLHPSSADLQVASILGNDGIGFYIVNNPVDDVFVVVEPFETRKLVPVDADSLTDILNEHGLLAKTLANYEFRPQQLEMIRAISSGINEEKIAVIEAGTGTGKTLAYLLPAITHAVQNKERIVVSTNTINLQEQLIHKDLPLLKSVLKQPFSAVLVKGRTNYACKRKLSEARQDLDLFADESDRVELDTILKWAKQTKDGSRADLNVEPRRDVWEKIQSESDTSLKTKCPFYNECFFYSARRKAATADILVANHHLLFSDLAVRAARGASENAVLPSYDRIVFDEAHNIEDVATNYFGSAVTYLGILRILSRLYRSKDDEEKGLLPFLSAKLTRLAKPKFAEKISEIREKIRAECTPQIDQVASRLREVMVAIYTATREGQKAEFGENKLRLTPDLLNTEPWPSITEQVSFLVKSMRHCTANLTRMLRRVDQMQYSLGPKVQSLTIDIAAQSDRLLSASNAMEQILLSRDDATVRWVEAREGYKGSMVVRIRSAPLDVAGTLKEQVFEKFSNVILTSATLTVENSFAYLKNRLGLNLVESARLIELMLPAPFDYKSQVFIGIPTDLPDPRDRSFTESLPSYLLEAISISGGKTFVLFTSYGLLNIMYQRVHNEIENLGFNVYKQGQENRHRLLERFRQDTTSVLFATDSFWEGVDVQGESLESVIMVKLPFRVPSEPVIQARIEALEREGKNAFMDYTVPQAVIKFRQGFGRLIRSKTDRGAILLYDKRVIQKYYGKTFLNSLPRSTIVAARKDEVFAGMRSFFS